MVQVRIQCHSAFTLSCPRRRNRVIRRVSLDVAEDWLDHGLALPVEAAAGRFCQPDLHCVTAASCPGWSGVAVSARPARRLWVARRRDRRRPATPISAGRSRGSDMLEQLGGFTQEQLTVDHPGDHRRPGGRALGRCSVVGDDGSCRRRPVSGSGNGVGSRTRAACGPVATSTSGSSAIALDRVDPWRCPSSRRRQRRHPAGSPVAAVNGCTDAARPSAPASSLSAGLAVTSAATTTPPATAAA